MVTWLISLGALTSQPPSTRKLMNHRKLQPSGDHILIEFAETARGRRSAARRNPRKKASAARVVAVGPGQPGADGNLIPLGLKVGEKVMVNGTRGIRIRLNRQSYAVIRKADLVSSPA